MQLSKDGLQFIAKYETIDGKPNLTAIKSPEQPFAGKVKYEIGFGHNSDSYFVVNKDSVITEQQAYEILNHDANEAVRLVNVFIRKYKLKFEQHEFDAMVSAVYNGIPLYNGKIGLSKALISKDQDSIENEWGKWVYMTVNGRKTKANGLIKRRADELELFFCADYKRDK